MMKQSFLFSEAIPALRAPVLEVSGPLVIPTCPDTSLPWSQDYAHGGWSARMFLHQMLAISRFRAAHLLVFLVRDIERGAQRGRDFAVQCLAPVAVQRAPGWLWQT